MSIQISIIWDGISLQFMHFSMLRSIDGFWGESHDSAGYFCRQGFEDEIQCDVKKVNLFFLVKKTIYSIL